MEPANEASSAPDADKHDEHDERRPNPDSAWICLPLARTLDSPPRAERVVARPATLGRDPARGHPGPERGRRLLPDPSTRRPGLGGLLLARLAQQRRLGSCRAALPGSCYKV